MAARELRFRRWAVIGILWVEYTRYVTGCKVLEAHNGTEEVCMQKNIFDATLHLC